MPVERRRRCPRFLRAPWLAILAITMAVAACMPAAPENEAPADEFAPGVDEPRGGAQTELCDPASDVYLPGAAENLEEWAEADSPEPATIEEEVEELIERLESVEGLEADVDLVRVQAIELLENVDPSGGPDALTTSAGDLRRIAAAACDELH